MLSLLSLADLTLGQDVSWHHLLYAFVAVTPVLCMSFCIRSNIVDSHGHPIPPGPLMRYAFLGRYPERALHMWAQKHGPLFSLFLGSQLFMVISDPSIAHDLLITNGKIFSSRKKYFVKNQTILRGRAITATPYDSTWLVHCSLAILMKF
jgi:Cytochrome P450